MRRFTRLALGFSKKLETSQRRRALHRPLQLLPDSRTIRMTPAMKAGIAGHPWTLEELLARCKCRLHVLVLRDYQE